MSNDLSLDQKVDFGAEVRPHLVDANDVRVSLCRDEARFSLRARPALRDVWNKELSLQLPETVCHSWRNDDVHVFTLGPDEWQINCPEDKKQAIEAQLLKTADGAPYSLVDVSHRQLAFMVEGRRATSILSAGCPLDLDLAAFPVEKCTRTVFERASIMIYRQNADQFRFETWRSFAPYVLMILKNASSRFSV